MPRVLNRETSLGLMFLAVGCLLFTPHDFVFHTLVHADNLAAALYPYDLRHQQLFLSGVALAFAFVVFFSFVTAWGLIFHRDWARWTGLVPSALLLLGLPWLTAVGALGLYLLLSQPRPKPTSRPEEDFWKPGRRSAFGIIASTAGFIATLQSLSIFEKYAHRMGLPDLKSLNNNSASALAFLAILLLGTLLHSVLHECGHALAALFVGFRVKAINAGPITVRRDAHGYHIAFEWQRLLSGGGYVGAVPASGKGVWPKEILVGTAGPVTSLAAAVALTWVFFHLPGTSFAPFSMSFALASLQGYFDMVVNLLPIGYTDGAMLVHLILRTPRGEELIARILSGQAGEDAHERRIAGDHEGSLTLQRAALQRLMNGGGHNPLELALAHTQLGSAELAAGSLVGAEASFRGSVDVLANSGGNPGIEADCWIGLRRVYLTRQRPAEAHQAYQSAWQALVRLGRNPPAGIDPLRVQGGIAELHSSACAFEPALTVIAGAMPSLSKSPEHRRLRGLLLRFRARCEMQLGHPALGLAAAEEAAALLGPIGSRTRAADPQALGMLALDLWQGGQSEHALPLLTECVGLFERRGEPNPALRFRLVLVDVLWRDGRISEAENALPDPAQFKVELRKGIVQQRAAVHEKAGRAQEALADYQEVLRLVEADPRADELEVAVAKSTLAQAHLEAGNLDDAEPLAHDAWSALSAVDHPEAANTCVTLALTSWRKERTTRAWLDQGLQRFEEAPLILHANKARFFESTATRLEKAGLLEEASRFRVAAESHWQSLGLLGKSSTCPVSV